MYIHLAILLSITARLWGGEKGGIDTDHSKISINYMIKYIHGDQRMIETFSLWLTFLSILISPTMSVDESLFLFSFDPTDYYMPMDINKYFLRNLSFYNQIPCQNLLAFSI